MEEERRTEKYLPTLKKKKKIPNLKKIKNSNFEILPTEQFFILCNH